MTKSYEILVPISNYIKFIGLSIILIVFLYVNFKVDSLPNTLIILSWIFSSFAIVLIIIQLRMITRLGQEIEISNNRIKTKSIDISILDIDKIIIEGYYVKNIGIKRVGQRFVSAKLYFRFKNDGERHLKEWEEWAAGHGIKVERGKVKTFI